MPCARCQTTFTRAIPRSVRVLWLKNELLHPVNRGGRIRTFEMLRQLKRDHEITYVGFTGGPDGPESIRRASEYCNHLVSVPFLPTPETSVRIFSDLLRSLLSREPFLALRYRAPSMRRAIRELLTAEEFDVVVCDFPFPAVNLPDSVEIPIVLFQHNVEALIWRRHADTTSNPLRRAFFRLQWHRMKSWEQRVCHRCDRVIAVSEVDAKRMDRDYELGPIEWVDTGVDTEFFRSEAVAPVPSDVAFVGALDWMPNEDGIEWLCSRVWPQIRAHSPAARFLVVGRNPTSKIVDAIAASPGVCLVGEVPDVRPYLAGASVVVVPLRVGGGTRLKIPEALAMEKAVVSTSVGAEGLEFVDGEHLLIRDDEVRFADAVLGLLQDEGERRRLGQSGSELVRSRYDWESVTRAFSAALVQAAREGCRGRA